MNQDLYQNVINAASPSKSHSISRAKDDLLPVIILIINTQNIGHQVTLPRSFTKHGYIAEKVKLLISRSSADVAFQSIYSKIKHCKHSICKSAIDIYKSCPKLMQDVN